MLAVAITKVKPCTLLPKIKFHSPNPSNAKKESLILPTENPWSFPRMARRTWWNTVGATRTLSEGDRERERRVVNLKPKTTTTMIRSLTESRNNRHQAKTLQEQHNTCRLKKVPRQTQTKKSTPFHRQSIKKMWLITRPRNKRSGSSTTSPSRPTTTPRRVSTSRWKPNLFLRPR